jgi:hypothetical protein
MSCAILNTDFYRLNIFLFVPFPVVTYSKLRIHKRSLAGFVGTIPAGGIYVCLLWLLCVASWRLLLRKLHSSRKVIHSVVCLNVNVKPLKEKDLFH